MNEYFSYQTHPSILLFPYTKLLFKKKGNDMATYKKSEITIVLHQIQLISVSRLNHVICLLAYLRVSIFNFSTQSFKLMLPLK